MKAPVDRVCLNLAFEVLLRHTWLKGSRSAQPCSADAIDHSNLSVMSLIERNHQLHPQSHPFSVVQVLLDVSADR